MEEGEGGGGKGWGREKGIGEWGREGGRERKWEGEGGWGRGKNGLDMSRVGKMQNLNSYSISGWKTM